MTTRIIAQRIRTGEIVDRDVQIKQPAVTRELSGPGGITGRLEPELRQAIALDGRPILDEWSTALYYEDGGQIRGGGIVQTLEWQGPAMTVNAPGFCSYAAGQPIMKNYTPTAFEDPVKVFKKLWTYLQSQPRSNIGLHVNGPDTYLRLGDGAGPYNIKAWEYRDVGQELENIATVSPFDYVESHVWTDSSKTKVGHELKVGFPRIGRLREDLRLVQGENVVRISTVGLDGDRFANVTYVLGEGEGKAMIVGTAATGDDGRLRRAAVVARKAATKGLATVYARDELRGRALAYDISEVVIKKHPNAPFGSINPGDDILTDIDVPHLGHIRMNLRVLSITEGGEKPDEAILKTMRSDFFVYAPAASPTGKTVLVTV